MLEILNLFRLAGQTLVLLMRKMDRLVFEETLSFKMLGVSFSSKLDCDCYIVSVGKT